MHIIYKIIIATLFQSQSTLHIPEARHTYQEELVYMNTIIFLLINTGTQLGLLIFYVMLQTFVECSHGVRMRHDQWIYIHEGSEYWVTLNNTCSICTHPKLNLTPNIAPTFQHSTH